MAQWQRKLELADVYRIGDDEEKVPELAGIIATRLLALAPFGIDDIDEERAEIVNMFKEVESEKLGFDEFNDAMENLYNWADQPLDDNWNGKKVCWVNTL